MRLTHITGALLLSAFGLSFCGVASAQGPKKPGGAPPPKATPQTGVRAATQMAGDNGQIGQNYMIGPKGDELVFTLAGAEFSVIPAFVGDDKGVIAAMPKGEEKLLILRFSIQNPQATDAQVDAEEFTITAVDAKDVNRVAPFLGKQGTTEPVHLALKPAQKIDAFTAIPVPAEGPVPKLIIQRGEGTPVLRYDLRGKVKPLAAPFARDPMGVSALAEVKGAVGAFYPLQRLSLRLDSTAFAAGPFNDQAPEEGQRYFTATVTLRNADLDAFSYGNDALKAELTLASGAKVEAAGIVQATRGVWAAGSLKRNETVTCRLFFLVPNDDGPRTLRIQEGEDSRTYVFDVAGTK